MRDGRGRFTKGHRASRDTEFKEGHHWRDPKLYWDRDWLYQEYIVFGKSASQIASEQGCCENNILYFLHKLGIKTRTTTETRAIKYWGASGQSNPMFGRTGANNPNWHGGHTPKRQAFYCSIEWADAAKGIWERDQAKCRKCGALKTNDNEFHIHHIVPFSVAELRAKLSNLILLCKECHNWVHSKKNEKGVMRNDNACPGNSKQDSDGG